MNGDITLEALRRCQRASKVISSNLELKLRPREERMFQIW